MEGAARAAERRFDRDLSLAWHSGAFSGAAQAGKLKALKSYQRKQSEPQTPEQMLAVLQTLQKAGAPMDIREVN